MKKLFIIQLYHKNKLLFSFTILFIIFQLLFTYKGVETFPFFNYGMYSSTENSVNTPKEIDFFVNNKKLNLNNYSLINQSFLHNNIVYYSELKQNRFKDPINDIIDNRFSEESSLNKLSKKQLANNNPQLFIGWLKHYLAQKTSLSINKLTIKQGNNTIIDE